MLEDYLTKNSTNLSVFSIYTVTIYVIFEKQGPCPRHDTRAFFICLASSPSWQLPMYPLGAGSKAKSNAFMSLPRG